MKQMVETLHGGLAPPCFVVAAPSSGGGKTTVAVGLMRALTNRGLAVQSFKVGMDFVDPACHAIATGQPGLNLDMWTMGARYMNRLLDLYGSTADAIVIEGVMGLFDGAPGAGAPGSTAELARTLGVPVVLVVDAAASAQSVAAIALGFQTYDPSVKLAGVIANRIASERHSQMVAEGLARVDIPYFGGVPSRDELALPDARGGLVLDGTLEDWIEASGAAVEEGVNLEKLLQATLTPSFLGGIGADLNMDDGKCTDGSPGTDAQGSSTLPGGSYSGLRLAIARDAAFRFYYYDALRWLEQLGVELVPFSPLTDGALPEEIDGIYIGGGFPDRFAAELARNERMKDALRSALAAGMPCYAEAGGFQYLLEELQVGDETYEMVGHLQGRTVIERRLQGIGNRFAEAAASSWLSEVGQVRGRVFHYGRPEGLTGDPAWQLTRPAGGTERVDGIVTDSIVASYLYVHFPTQPRLVDAFLARCRRFGETGSSAAVPSEEGSRK